MMTEQLVFVDRTAAVATITLNDPERRNALTKASKEALRDAVADAAHDEKVRAVVLAATGTAFCVGQDLGEHAQTLTNGAEAAFATVREHYSPVVRDLLTMPKPVVAAVSGAAVGAGLGLALACDFRVFAAGTKLATAFTGIGLTFDSGLSFTLSRALGNERARELMLLGRTFTAEDAVFWGIAGEIAQADEVLNRAVTLARDLASGPTAAFAITKELLLASGFAENIDAVLEAEALGQTRAGTTKDHGLAVTAFLAKETPAFTGR